MPEGKKLDPIISEFETEEQAAAYDKWFQAKVQASLDDRGENIPHDEVMQRMTRVISDAAGRNDASPSGFYDPIASEFQSAEDEASYERWLIARVEKSLADPRPSVPHDEVIASAETIIARAEARLKKRA